MKKLLLLATILTSSTTFCLAQFSSNNGNTTTPDKVGIGTTNPLNKLDVSGNISLSSGGNNVFRILQGVYAGGFTGPGFYSQTDVGYGAGNGGKHVWIGLDGNTEIMRLDNFGHLGIGTNNPAAVLQIHNNVGYTSNANNQILLTNSGYRNGEYVLPGNDNAALAFYFTNYNAGSKQYDRTLDIKVRGSGDGTFGAGMIRFFANDYSSGSIEREIMRIHGNGYVGIGTTQPNSKLQVNYAYTDPAGITIQGGPSSSNALSIIGSAGDSGSSVVSITPGWNTNASPCALDISPTGVANGNDTRLLNISYSGSNKMVVMKTGNVGIGTTNPDQKLTVNGTIHSTQVKIDLNVPGPDYVFKKNYHLPELLEVKSYIDKNHHLSEIPSAAQMEKNGVDLGEMNIKLLKKVEELTLYLIEIKKENSALNKRVAKLEKSK